MAPTNGYCTEAQVRAELSDTDSRLSAALIDKAINASSRAIDKYCGRRFWQDSAVVARRYRPRDSGSVVVHDISTTTGLIIATDTTGDGTYATTWASTDYLLEPLDADADGGAYAWTGITAVGRYTFPTSGLLPPLRVTSKGGWSEIPDDVEEACVLRSVALVKRKEAPFGVAGFGDFGAVRITRRDADVVELLSGFMRIGIPET